MQHINMQKLSYDQSIDLSLVYLVRVIDAHQCQGIIVYFQHSFRGVESQSKLHDENDCDCKYEKSGKRGDVDGGTESIGEHGTETLLIRIYNCHLAC